MACGFSGYLSLQKAGDEAAGAETNPFWRAEGLAFSPQKPFSKNVVSVWTPGEYRSTVQIIFSGLAGDYWSFDSVSDPLVLAVAVREFADKIGVLPSFPIRTSQKLFEKLGDTPKRIETADLEAYFEPFLSAPEDIQIWSDRKRLRGDRIKVYDKKSMFLAATSKLPVGAGPYLSCGRVDSKFAKDNPGLYLVGKIKAIRKSPFTTFLAKCLGPFPRMCYTPIVDLLSQYFKFEIESGFYWSESAKVFDRFYQLVSKVKNQTAGSDIPSIKVVNGAVKSLYTDFFGFMRKREIAKSDYLSHWFRPDFRGAIVAAANANLFRNIASIFAETGDLPIAIIHDALFYNSRDFSGTVLESDRYSFECEFSADLWDGSEPAALNRAANSVMGD